jgi:hypothetical protein
MMEGCDLLRNPSSTNAELKDLVKTAVVEALEERHDLFVSLIQDAIEDIAMTRAIEEGKQTPVVSRKEIVDILEAKQ